MRDGGWASGSVRQVAPVVTGLPGVTVESVDISRDLPSSLPGQARSVGGLSAATATITGHVGSGATDRVATPWTRSNWPASGDRVTVSATDGTNTHRVLTGKVDGSSSSLADLGISVPLVDDTDRLSATVSHDAIFRTMPPRLNTGSLDRRMTGLLSTYVTNLAARAAGFYSTPPMGNNCVVSAPLAGCTWPERGSLDYSSRHQSVINAWNGLHPGTSALGDNIFMADMFAQYVPDPDNRQWSTGLSTEYDLQLTLGANANLETSGYVDVRWFASDGSWSRFIQLTVSSTRSLSGRIVTDGNFGEAEVVTSLPGDRVPGWRFATLTVRKVNGSVIEFSIETDTGVKSTPGQTTGGGTAIRDTMWKYATVFAPAYVGVNGMQVNYSRVPPARDFRRTFLHTPDDPLAQLDVMPHLSAVPARDILSKQSEVECAALWIDEDGVLRWLGHQRMIDGPVVRTLTSSEIADATIEFDSQDLRRQVTGKWKTWAPKTTSVPRLMVHEGPKDEYAAGDHGELVITPPEGEEWVMVSDGLEEIWGNIGSTRLNEGTGSFHGYTALRAEGSEIPFAASDGSTSWAFNPVGPGAWKWEFTVNSLPSGADRVKTSTRSEETEFVKPAYRGLGLPLLRSKGHATSVEDTYAVAGGPSWAGDLEVDFEWYVQARSQAIVKVQRIARELKTSRAMLKSFEVLADPRLQLGDNIRLREDARTGIEVVGTIVSKPEKIGPGDHTMVLDLNILSVTTPNVTLDEFDAYYSGMTLAELDAKFAGQTLAQVNANPLQ